MPEKISSVLGVMLTSSINLKTSESINNLKNLNKSIEVTYRKLDSFKRLKITHGFSGGLLQRDPKGRYKRADAMKGLSGSVLLASHGLSNLDVKAKKIGKTFGNILPPTQKFGMGLKGLTAKNREFTRSLKTMAGQQKVTGQSAKDMWSHYFQMSIGFYGLMQLSRGMNTASRMLAGTFFKLARAIADTGRKIESNLIVLKTFTGSMVGARSVLRDTLKLVEVTPFLTEDILGAVRAMQQVGASPMKVYGVYGDVVSDIDDFAKKTNVTAASMLSDLSATFGRPLDRVVFGFQRAIIAGGRNLRVLYDDIGPLVAERLFKNIQPEAGKTFGEQVFERLYEYLLEGGGMGMGIKLSKTLSGMLTNIVELQDKFIRQISGLPGEGGIYDKMVESLTRFYNQLVVMIESEDFKKFTEAVGTGLNSLFDSVVFVTGGAIELGKVVVKLGGLNKYVTSAIINMTVAIAGLLSAFASFSSIIAISGLLFVGLKRLTENLIGFAEGGSTAAVRLLDISKSLRGFAKNILFTKGFLGASVFAGLMVAWKLVHDHWFDLRSGIDKATEAVDNYGRHLEEVLKKGEKKGLLKTRIEDLKEVKDVLGLFSAEIKGKGRIGAAYGTSGDKPFAPRAGFVGPIGKEIDVTTLKDVLGIAVSSEIITKAKMKDIMARFTGLSDLEKMTSFEQVKKWAGATIAGSEFRGMGGMGGLYAEGATGNIETQKLQMKLFEEERERIRKSLENELLKMGLDITAYVKRSEAELEKLSKSGKGTEQGINKLVSYFGKGFEDVYRFNLRQRGMAGVPEAAILFGE